MSESGHSVAIAALRQAGADRLDPLRLHYLERLHARASMQQGRVQDLLNGKIAAAVAEMQACLVQTKRQPGEKSESKVAAPLAPGAEAVLAIAPRESLADLVRALAQQGGDPAQGGPQDAPGAPPEIKSIRQFRNTWSKLSADKQVNQALHQAPKNAGPINSHMLVLRSLVLMRDIAPDYLNRFVSYADTLLCLDQHQQGKQAPVAKTAAKTAAKAAGSAAGKKPAAKRTR